MSKFILGVVAGAAMAYACTNKKSRESMMHMCNSATEMFDKAKEKIKDGFDMGKNKAEYVADRAQNSMNS